MSAANALPLIKNFRSSDGNRLTVETCHHYLNLNAEDIPKNRVDYKCCPPIRDLENQKALWDALKSGDINMVVSDHSPSTAEMKLLVDGPDYGNFMKSWGGISSVQFGMFRKKMLRIKQLMIQQKKIDLLCTQKVCRYFGPTAKSTVWI